MSSNLSFSFQRLTIASAAFLGLVLLGASAPPSAGSSTTGVSHPDSASAVATVEKFHAAMARGDTSGVLALLASDVVIMESGGVETLSDYRSHHLGGDVAFVKAVPGVRAPLRATVSGDAAWVYGTSTSKGTYKGRVIDSVGAELMVLSAVGPEWKIRAIHWSSRSRAPRT